MMLYGVTVLLRIVVMLGIVTDASWEESKNGIG